MKVLGLITEYNPFHNGHSYHIKKSKEITGADYVIVVMSGNFVQRGTPALCDKYLRTKMALLNGADLVLELPVAYATASAEYFSMGAISTLDKLGVVDSICFGSEDGNITHLSNAANLLSTETPQYQESLKQGLKDGLTFPQARINALSTHNLELDINLLSSPNNILGIEYLKALKKCKSSITPHTIKRHGSGYHDKFPLNEFSSATAIRTFFDHEENENWEKLKPLISSSVFDILKDEYQISYPILEEDFSSMLYYKLKSVLCHKENTLTDYFDVSEELGARIKNQIDNYSSFLDFSDILKTRQYTLTRIRRSLLHILLDIKKEDILLFSKNDYILYARILGFNTSSGELLSKIKNNSTIPLLSKLADADNLLEPIGKKMLQQDIFASDLFRHVQESKFKSSLPNEYRRSIIKIS
ncbi:MAG: nucleotidyltransferase [Clostridiales bacterium]|nr:nucleotidyltransferase [Clostridiales bacterium]